ncbi:MAG TPA: IscS subfamily cysteine desulfurase [Patescibacteria group bacterium]|nr:IscS subfamily cysteine desulfurase [Patescibacteria group bacterium]
MTAVNGTTNAGLQRPIYLDYQATTPCDPRVVEAMLPYFTEKFGNPHSRNHAYGWEAEEAVEQAREQVAAIIGADPKEIIFTSGATESNNLAIKGVANFYRDKKDHIITVVTEHKCVLDSCRHLEQEGFKVTYLPVHKNGLIDLAQLEAAITDRTALVSVMAVNNEIGVIQPLAEIGAICRKHHVFFHTDAAQGVGKMPLDVNAMNIDLMSISGHKIYGPKGIGALFVRRRPRVRLQAIINGGGQERGMRSGTLPTPMIVGLGEACRIAQAEMGVENERMHALRDRLLTGINARLPECYVNGDLEQRVPGNLNISFAFVEGEGLMMGVKDIAVSSGSACTSASLEPSYVLRALGLDAEMAHTSLRLGFGRFTTEAEIDYAINHIVEAVSRLRELSPLWEMHQEGIDIKSIQWAGH